MNGPFKISEARRRVPVATQATAVAGAYVPSLRQVRNGEPLANYVGRSRYRLMVNLRTGQKCWVFR